MNQTMFPYLSRKIADEFSCCGWQDSIGASFQSKELHEIEYEMKQTELLADEIEQFIRQAEQLIEV